MIQVSQFSILAESTLYDCILTFLAFSSLQVTTLLLVVVHVLLHVQLVDIALVDRWLNVREELHHPS